MPRPGFCYPQTKEPPEAKPRCRIISKNFAVSSSAVDYWGTTLAKPYTTTQIYNLLVNKHFDRYLYNGNGSGCLTWTTRLVKELEDEGVLPAGALASFNAKVAYHFQYNACDILNSHFSCLKYGPQMKGINTFQNASSVPLMCASSLCRCVATYSNHGG